MKTFLTINILLLLLNACSYDNAFSRFDISPQRAKSEESIISSKIYNETDIIGVVSCVYLNTINPKKYKNSEYFYIYLYTKDTQAKITFTLNDVNATVVEELEANNEFVLLTDSNVTWEKYYFVKFAQQDTDLTLTTKIAHFSSGAIVFKKDD